MDYEELYIDGKKIGDVEKEDDWEILAKATAVGAVGLCLLAGGSLTWALIGGVGGFGIAHLLIGEDD